MPTTYPLLLPGVQMTADEFVTVNFRLWRQRPRTRFNHWLLGLAVLLLAGSVALDICRTGHISNQSTVVFLAVAVLYALVRMQLVRYQLRRGYARNTGLHAPISFELDAERLRGRSADGHFEARWQVLRRAVWVHPDWLLLYPTEAACYYLDLRRLQAPATPEQVLALLLQHQIPVQEL
ncbi:hypothetical protein [Hymenobacter sp. APR13]|uniref:hypothetical protein n=1 Tax=Hymenobacter sp. APR13 TaxID=1356852 RepID=UPI000B0C6C49|nr:hypothetical protein [Hymenobacter sp. APR13]